MDKEIIQKLIENCTVYNPITREIYKVSSSGEAKKMYEEIEEKLVRQRNLILD